MKRNLLFALLLVMQMASAAVRNPFTPFVSPCDALLHQLNLWTLHGTVGAQNSVIALMRNPQNGWRRVISTTELEAGIQVDVIDSHAVSVRLPSDCAAPLYSWKIRGTKHGMDATDRSADSLAAHECC